MFKLTSRLNALKRAGAVVDAAALIGAAVATPASAYGGGPWFVPNQPYATSNGTWSNSSSKMTVGDLANPDVFQDTDDTYYAYGTTMGGRNVPLITSKDLTNWTTNKAYKPSKSAAGRFPENGNDTYYNDSLALPGKWTRKDCSSTSNGCYEIWQPSATKAGNGKYVMAYAAHISDQGDKFGIGIATSDKPTGPFYDDSSQPFITGTDPKSVIDPDLYKDPSTGKLYIYWKNEGIAENTGSYPTKIHVREINATTGTSWAAGSSANDNLLVASQIADMVRSTNSQT